MLYFSKDSSEKHLLKYYLKATKIIALYTLIQNRKSYIMSAKSQIETKSSLAV